MDNQIKLELQEKLLALAKNNGFITVDEIINYSILVKIPLDYIDSIYNFLHKNNIIIRDIKENDNLNNEIKANKKSYIYKSIRDRVDYETIFNRIIKIDNSIKYYIDELKIIPPPKKNEADQLIYQARKGNKYARERLIKMFLKVPVRMSLYYHDAYGFPIADTIQDGNRGLIFAVEKIPLKDGYKFGSYASFWIKQTIQRRNISLSRKLIIPERLKNDILKIKKIMKNHIFEISENQSLLHCIKYISEISSILSLSYKQVKYLFSFIEPVISIEKYKNRRFKNTIFSDEYFYIDNVINNITLNELKYFLRSLLNNFNEKEIKVIEDRFGINTNKSLTFEEIANKLSMSREGIRQIERKVLDKIRASEFSNILLDFYDNLE